MVCFRIFKSALLISFAAVVLSFASAVNAQTFRGTILGTVTDTSGAAVPGAKVSIVNVGITVNLSTSVYINRNEVELRLGTSIEVYSGYMLLT